MNGRALRTIAWLHGGAIALAMMLPTVEANADQADDPAADQRLLETRVDQFAAVGQQPGLGAVFSVDQNAAAGAAVTAGDFPRSILIPGTDTSLKIYGTIFEIMDYWMSGGGSVVNSSPQTVLVGANGILQSISLRGTTASTRGNGVFSQTPRASRIGFETRTPTPFGEARAVMEFDWGGTTTTVPGGSNPTSVSDNLIPRLRYGYGTVGGFLAGQATSNFSDPDANSETLDFGGNVGEPGHVRIPQVRWTMPAWWGGSFSVSAETPDTIIATPVGLEASDAGVVPTATTSCPISAATGLPTPSVTPTAQTCSTSLLTSGQTPLNISKSTAPDFTAAWYLPQPWGHLDFSAVLRPGIDATDGRFFSKNFIGYGGHFGMDIKPGWFGWVKDDITAHFTIGDTIGPYLSSSTNFDLATNYGAPSTTATTGNYGGVNGPTSAASASLIRFKPTQEMGAEIGYQHWWLDNLRSDINGGFNAHYGIPISLVNNTGPGIIAASSGGQAAAINKELISAHVNLIWNPVSFVGIGIEYMWGQRTVLNNQTATENVLISNMVFHF